VLAPEQAQRDGLYDLCLECPVGVPSREPGVWLGRLGMGRGIGRAGFDERDKGPLSGPEKAV